MRGKRKAQEQPPHPAEILGEVAEHTRSFFSKKGAKPPGLQTISNPDGSMQVIADNPEAGLAISVTVSLLAPQVQPQVGIGPQPAAPSLAQPALPGAPAGAVGQTPVGIGP